MNTSPDDLFRRDGQLLPERPHARVEALDVPDRYAPAGQRRRELARLRGRRCHRLLDQKMPAER
jgi:hypothetical protein